jgi:AcrR family transcriptional regulator
MARPRFASTDFLAAARALARQHGPAAVTVGSVIGHMGAPAGSFYYRYASRDLLLGELWLETVLAYQKGFLAAIEAGDGLAAALHTPAWARENLEDARLLLLHRRSDFIHGDWPEALRDGVVRQEETMKAAVTRFAQATLGDATPDNLNRARFALVGAPLAAVRMYLERREPPPPITDELIRLTYNAVIAP